jgi:hypothetical protein
VERGDRAGRTAAWAGAAASALAIALLAIHRTGSLAGDPFAVYFPVAQNLLRGFRLDAFGPLWHGPGRQPGLPMLIALVAEIGAFSDLFRAAELLSVVGAITTLAIMLGASARLGGGPRPVLAAALIALSSWPFVRAALEALPDMACLGLTALTIALLAARSSWAPWLAGASAGLAALIRPNGIVLLPAGLLAIALERRADRGRALTGFVLAFALGLSPLAAPMVGLGAHGMTYPIPSTKGTILIREDESYLFGLLRQTARGLIALPDRLRRAASLPVLLLGAPALVWGAVVRRESIAVVALIVFVAMCGSLLPLHFEARYYLFAFAMLAVAAPLGLEAMLLRSMRLARTRSGPALAFAALLLGLLVWTGREVVREVPAEQRVVLEFERLCVGLGRLGPSRDAPVTVGARPADYLYSLFRECPHPARQPSRVVLVSAGLTDPGLDAYLSPAGQAPAGAEVGAIGGNVLTALPSPPRLLTSTRATSLLENWAFRVPKERGEGCERRPLRLSPGPHRLIARLGSDLPLAATLEVLRAGSSTVGAVRLVGAGSGRPAVQAAFEAGPEGIAEARLCAADPLRAPGTIVLLDLIDAPP